MQPELLGDPWDWLKRRCGVPGAASFDGKERPSSVEQAGGRGTAGKRAGVGGFESPAGAPASSAATTCEHGYTGDERDSCACPTCSEQQLLVKVKELTALLREFEAVPVRRLTNHTAVYERSPLDTWRARCGKAVRGWL